MMTFNVNAVIFSLQLNFFFVNPTLIRNNLHFKIKKHNIFWVIHQNVGFP